MFRHYLNSNHYWIVFVSLFSLSVFTGGRFEIAAATYRLLYLKRQKRVQRPFCGKPRNPHQSKLSILIVYQISQNMSENKRPADEENGSNGATDTKKPKSVSTFCLFQL